MLQATPQANTAQGRGLLPPDAPSRPEPLNVPRTHLLLSTSSVPTATLLVDTLRMQRSRMEDLRKNTCVNTCGDLQVSVTQDQLILITAR